MYYETIKNVFKSMFHTVRMHCLFYKIKTTKCIFKEIDQDFIQIFIYL